MSSPQRIPQRPPLSDSASPTSSPKGDFLIPSPVPTRRTRTVSQSERAAMGPTHTGVIENFCRERGHGFITPHEGTEHIFLHISDIESEYVPQKGDVVEYKMWQIPPKNIKFSAIQVRITHPAPGKERVKWETPLRDVNS